MLKYLRVMACAFVLTALKLASVEERAKFHCLQLCAAIIWMFNSVQIREDDTWEGHRQIRDACCFYEPYDEQNGADVDPDYLEEGTPAGHKFGIWMLAAIIADGKSLRTAVPRAIDGDRLARLFGFHTMEQLYEKFQITNLWNARGHEVRNPTRTYNRRRGAGNPFWQAPEDIAVHMGLAAKGVKFIPTRHYRGRDVDENHTQEASDFVEGLLAKGVDYVLDGILNMFANSVIGVAPNIKGKHEAGYCELTEAERDKVNNGILLTHDLRGLFSSSWWGKSDITDWKRLFGWFFPDRPVSAWNYGSGQPQNYAACRYYILWRKVISADVTSDRDLEIIRDAFWKEFQKFVWVPSVESDRIWRTQKSPMPTRYTYISCSPIDPMVDVRRLKAPMLSFNQTLTPQIVIRSWKPLVGPKGMAQEEEEGSVRAQEEEEGSSSTAGLRRSPIGRDDDFDKSDMWQRTSRFHRNSREREVEDALDNGEMVPNGNETNYMPFEDPREGDVQLEPIGRVLEQHLQEARMVSEERQMLLREKQASDLNYDEDEVPETPLDSDEEDDLLRIDQVLLVESSTTRTGKRGRAEEERELQAALLESARHAAKRAGKQPMSAHATQQAADAESMQQSAQKALERARRWR
jgi:hypothetical protein